MHAKALKAFLIKAIQNGLTVLVKGQAGGGKTSLIEQASAECGAELIVMHPVVSDPTDFKGLPGIVNDEAAFLPYGELRKLMTAKKLTVCCIDDLGQAPVAVQAAVMQLVLARQVNGHKISDKVVFVAATNRREDKAGVSGILEPLKSRFTTIVELSPSVDDWREWAMANGMPIELIAFVSFRPKLLLEPGAPTSDIVNRPSPRTVANVGKLFAMGLNTHEVLAGAAGAEFASEFLAFVQMYHDLPDRDSIFKNPDKAAIPTTPAALYAVAVMVASNVTKANAGPAARYLVRLPDEYSALGMRDTLKRCPEAADCREVIAWFTKNQDSLV